MSTQTTQPTQTAQPTQTTQPTQTAQQSIILPSDDIQTIIKKTESDLTNELSNFETLNIPVNINDNNTICQPWSNYDNGQYSEYGSNCAIIDSNNPTVYYCVDTNNNIQTCNNYITPEVINNMQLNVNDILTTNESQFNTMLQNYLNIVQDLDAILNDSITSVSAKGYIANEQSYFYNNNQTNINAKLSIKNKYSQDAENNTNDANISKNNIENSNIIINKHITYSKYLKYLIYILLTICIITYILNILFSKV